MDIPSIHAALQAGAVPRDSLSVAADVAVVAVGVAVVILVLVLIFVLLKVHRGLTEVRLGVRQNLGPVSDRARSISDNVEFITQALRTDVERLNQSVRALSDRLQLASDRMEERIEEFNALMEVVQGEAEGVFLDTAATVRGVRASAEHLVAGAPSPDESELDDSASDGADHVDAEALEARAGSEPGA